MRTLFAVAILFALFSMTSHSQDMAKYTSGWEGTVEHAKTFNLKVEVHHLGLEKAKFRISNDNFEIDYVFDSTGSPIIEIPIAENYSFKGMLSKNGKEINGFIKSGMLFYHLKLIQTDRHSFEGNWNLLMIDELKSLNFYLSIENGDGNKYQAYPVLGDDRFTGTWCYNFQKQNDIIWFTDFKTGLQFKGKLAVDGIQLGICLGNNLLTHIELQKSKTDWKIGGFNSGSKTNRLKLLDMESQISKDSLPNTHAVLISQKGKLIYENYF